MDAIRPSQAVPEAENGASRLFQGTVRILILEDNPFDSELMELELKQSGIDFESRRVDSEHPYRQALREFCPDLILSDYDLPQFSGLRALKIARDLCPDVPFILVTGAVGEDRAIEILTSGATDYVLKSRLSRLVPAVRRALHENYEHRKRRQAETERDVLLKELEKRVQERTESLQAEIKRREETEKRLHESMERLNQSSAELNRAQAVAKTGSWRFDFRTREVYWSEETYRIFGIPFNTPISHDLFYSAVHPGDRQALERSWQSASEGKTYDIEYRILVGSETKWIRSRAEFDCDQEGRPLRGFGTNQDITDLKRTEAALKESEAIFRAIFDLTGIGMCQAEPASGTLLRVNDAFLKMVGYDRKALNGKTLLDITHPDDRQANREGMSRLVRGEIDVYDIEKRFIRKDGSVLWALVAAVLIRDPEGNPARTVVTVNDITGRKQTENTLRENEERFRLAQEAGKVGVFDWELDKDECIITQELARMYGFPPGYRPTARDWINFVHPDDRRSTYGKILEAFRERKEEIQDEYRIVGKDGRIIWLSNHSRIFYESGKPVRMIGTSADVTERKQAEIALQAAEEKLRLAVESTELGTFDMDPRTGKIDWSLNSKLQFGLPPDAEVDYDTFLKGLHPEDRERIDGLVHRLFGGEQGGVYSTELRTIGIRDGKLRWLASWGRVFFDESGRPVRFIGVSADITDLKRTEESLKKRTAELESINKELESFSYSVSHDLRAPLRAVKGFAGIILRQYGPYMQSDIRDKFSLILENAGKMEALIEDLLNLSRLGRGRLNRSEFDMKRLALEVWRELTQMTGSGTELIMDDLPTARGDRNLLRHVLVNLLSNALKFTRSREHPRIEIGGSRQRGENVYFVKDNGVGFDMQYRARLFGVFQRLHGSEYEGTGVGLAIVKRIIHRHGGKVWAESEPGRGATFYFSLPLPEDLLNPSGASQ